jgi:hypothetical protein
LQVDIASEGLKLMSIAATMDEEPVGIMTIRQLHREGFDPDAPTNAGRV